jgi:hypothetical protein
MTYLAFPIRTLRSRCKCGQSPCFEKLMPSHNRAKPLCRDGSGTPHAMRSVPCIRSASHRLKPFEHRRPRYVDRFISPIAIALPPSFVRPSSHGESERPTPACRTGYLPYESYSGTVEHWSTSHLRQKLHGWPILSPSNLPIVTFLAQNFYGARFSAYLLRACPSSESRIPV